MGTESVPLQLARDFGVTGLAALLFLLFWRGSDKLGIIGFGAEYQKRRIAEERLATAAERTETAQKEIKDLLAGLPGAVGKVVGQVVKEVLAELLPERRSPLPVQPAVPLQACEVLPLKRTPAQDTAAQK